eukprot:jgi/Botrbrau1/12247/Bobra.0361s0010.1
MERMSQERSQQITELLQQVPTCMKIPPGDRFETPLRLPDGSITKLQIMLPPNFPQGPPLLSLTNPLRHPWMQANGRLSFRNLDQWSYPRSRLANVVQEVFAGLSGQRQSQTPPPGWGPAASSRVPRVPDSFPEVEAKTHEELLQLLTEEGALQGLVRDIMARSHLSQLAGQMRAGNLSLAQANLAKEDVLRELRNQLAIIRSSDYAAAKEAFDEKYARQQGVLAKLRPDKLLDTLSTKINEADQASEELQDKFLRGDVPLDAFVEAYLKQRILYHQRDLKRQAASQQLM